MGNQEPPDECRGLGSVPYVYSVTRRRRAVGRETSSSPGPTQAAVTRYLSLPVRSCVCARLVFGVYSGYEANLKTLSKLRVLVSLPRTV